MKNLFRARRVATLSSVAGLILSGAIYATSPASSATGGGGLHGTINLAGILAETGTAYGVYGSADAIGMNSAAEAINKKGGIDGHKISIDVIDDQSLPTTAAIAAQQLVSESPPPTFIFHWCNERRGVGHPPDHGAGENPDDGRIRRRCLV